MEVLTYVYKMIIACLGGMYGFLFGDTKGCITALFCFICIDFISGVLTGLVEKNLSSRVAWSGIIRKLYEVLIVVAAHMIDKYVVGTGDVVLTSVCFLFISTEGISLLENAVRLGVPIPKSLVSTLSQLKVKAGGIATVDDIKKFEADNKHQTPDKDEKEELNDETLISLDSEEDKV